ncbi:MAG: ABC transporter permease, partial [Faecousia sp.]
CILSTMVLVMMLGAGSLYFGAEDSLNTRYPKDINLSVDYLSGDPEAGYTAEKADMLVNEVNAVIDSFGIETQNMQQYLSTNVTAMLNSGKLIADRELVDQADLNSMDYVCAVYFVPLGDYNRCMDEKETLEENQVLLHCVRRTYDDPIITMTDGTVLEVKKQLDDFMGSGDAALNMIPTVFIVVNDLESIIDSLNAELGNINCLCRPELTYSFDIDAPAEEKIELSRAIRQRIRDIDLSGAGGFYAASVECRESERDDFYGTYGGIFFLGIILSIVFLLATVLIIYYKQISEGYEDQARFEIMQKVGMTTSDIRKSINSQMLTVFFLPLLTAALHLSFAFPMVQKLLALFNLRNVPLMLIVMAVTVLVFGVFYAVIYKVTSNAYFSIVSGTQND